MIEQTFDSTPAGRRHVAARTARAAIAAAFVALLAAGGAEAMPAQQKKHRHGEPANRAQAAVAEFQYAPGIEEGLFIMSESYDKLGLTQLRDDARRVLDKNFPSSIYASGNEGKRKPWWQLW